MSRRSGVVANLATNSLTLAGYGDERLAAKPGLSPVNGGKTPEALKFGIKQVPLTTVLGAVQS
jgi:hypothetical protein